MIRFMIRLSTCLKFYARNKEENQQQSIEQVRRTAHGGVGNFVVALAASGYTLDTLIRDT